MKTVHIIRDGSLLQAVVPLEQSTTETPQYLQHLLASAWMRPKMRPKLILIGPRRVMSL